MKNALLIFFLAVTISAQSVHQSQNDFYKHLKNELKISNREEVSGYLGKTSEAKLSKMVFGFLPYWNYTTGNYKINPPLINRIAVFSFSADSLGNLTPPPMWPWNDILYYELSASPLGVRVMMTVTSFNGEHINGFLRNNEIKQNLIKNIKENLSVMSGVNIDFEYLKDEDKGEAIVNFMKELSDSVKNERPQAEISFSSWAVGYGQWDFKGLAEVCDYLFVMSYNFYGSWSSTTGPSAPLTGTYFSVTKTFNEEYKNVPPEKLLMGVLYDGNHWKTNSSQPYATVKPYDANSTDNDWLGFVSYDSAAALAEKHGSMWDNYSQTPYITWQDSTWHQIWYDDSLSLSKKYDLALQKNLKGIGIWALGDDGNRDELWNLIEKKFGVTDVNGEEQLPTDFVLYQNYPNPFNPETTISYTIPNVETRYSASQQHVTLKVYDILGREVATLVNEEQLPGKYSIKFNVETLRATSLPTGVYFYTLRVGDFSLRSELQTRKMVLVK